MNVSTNFGGNLFKIKQLFFDSATVKRLVDAATLKKLNYIGGLIRKTAQNSMETKKARSDPGKPPNVHTGLLKNNVLYSFDPATCSVVIGPVKMNAKGTDVPRTLECGGNVDIAGKWSLFKKRVVVSPRPYMAPALEKNQANISKIWANILK
jgi:hypothetical protein